MFSGLPPKADLPPDLRTTPAVNSERTPPSRPRASARSRALARGLHAAQRRASTATACLDAALHDAAREADAHGGDDKTWRLVADPPTLPECANIQCRAWSAEWQTSRITHPVRLRRKRMILLPSKRAEPPRPTRASSASSSPTAATTCTSLTSSMRRSRLTALSASSTVKASPAATDTVVFVLSPTSARSEICAWEVGEGR